MKSRLFAATVLFFVALSAQAQDKTITASTKEYNRLVFPEPYTRIVIPPTAQLADDPIPLQGHRSLLLRPAPGAEPMSLFVQLRSGESFTVRLVPDDDAEGAVFRYRDAPDMSEPPADENRPEDRWIAQVMLAALDGERPAGFEEGPPPPAARLFLDGDEKEHVSLEPLARYRGSQHDLSIYRLQATRLVNVEPRDFYRSGTVAVVVEGDVTGPSHSPLLLVLEAASE